MFLDLEAKDSYLRRVSFDNLWTGGRVEVDRVDSLCIVERISSTINHIPQKENRIRFQPLHRSPTLPQITIDDPAE